MNLELFEQIKACIREEPRRMRIMTWQDRRLKYLQEENKPQCGTVGCIAGWADILTKTGGSTKVEDIKKVDLIFDLNDPKPFQELVRNMTETGAKNLGITKGEAAVLFDPMNWPPYYRDRVSIEDPGTVEHAEAVIRAMDAFVKDPKEFTRHYRVRIMGEDNE